MTGLLKGGKLRFRVEEREHAIAFTSKLK